MSDNFISHILDTAHLMAQSETLDFSLKGYDAWRSRVPEEYGDPCEKPEVDPDELYDRFRDRGFDRQAEAHRIATEASRAAYSKVWSEEAKRLGIETTQIDRAVERDRDKGTGVDE